MRDAAARPTIRDAFSTCGSPGLGTPDGLYSLFVIRKTTE
jgi:hypothetical protein